MRMLHHDPERVTQAREAAGLTRTRLAQIVGCSLSLISEIESGTRNARAPRLRAIAEAVGVDYEALLAVEEAS